MYISYPEVFVRWFAYVLYVHVHSCRIPFTVYRYSLLLTHIHISVYIYTHTHLQMINPVVAEILNIPSHRIYANNLLFNVCMCFLVFIYEYPFVSYVFTYQLMNGWMNMYVRMYVWVYESISLYISAKFILC